MAKRLWRSIRGKKDDKLRSNTEKSSGKTRIKDFIT